MLFKKIGGELRTFQIGSKGIEQIREQAEAVVMADGLPRFLPDAFLGIELRTVGRKRNKLDSLYLCKKFSKSLVPRRIIPEDRNAFAGIQLQEPIQESLCYRFTLFVTPHAVFPARMEIERSVKTFLRLSGIGLDLHRSAPRLPDGRKRSLEEERRLVFRQNDRSCLFEPFQFFLTSLSHFPTASGSCSRNFLPGR